MPLSEAFLIDDIVTFAGDSGGPLHCKRKNARGWVLVGASSYTFGCDNNNAPQVYSAVSYHRQWIKRHTGI